METLGVTVGVVEIITLLEVTVVGVAHVAVDVITTHTLSPSFKVVGE